MTDTPSSEIELRRLKGKGSIRRLLFRIVLFGGMASLIIGLGSAAFLFWYYSKDLPQLNKITDYHPNLITNVYAVDEDDQQAELVAEYFLERRKIVPIETVPQLLKYAFVAAEDSNFYQHSGVDFGAIFRAAIANVKAGGFVQGGSTITQQVTKSLLLTRAKKISRKIKEAILARRIEESLSKDEILWLYLNQIYLGHGAYGVQAAAENYFDKTVEDLTIAEMAILAGLPKAPGRDSPLLHPERAKGRQGYVLDRMVAEGYITQQQATDAINEQVIIRQRPEPSKAAAWYTEHARRYIQDKYGDKMLYQEGLTVITNMRLDLQEKAQEKTTMGLRALDRRQGYRGPLRRISDEEEDSEQLPDDKIAAVRKKVQEKIASDHRRKVFEAAHPRTGFSPVELSPEPVLVAGKVYRAVVTKVNSVGDTVELGVGNFNGVMPLGLMAWARKPNPEVAPEWDPVRDPASVLKKGDVIMVRAIIVGEGDDDKDYTELGDGKQNAAERAYNDHAVFALEQTPLVESALLSVDVGSGNVRAMIGGRDPSISEFNRAIQARRQPGSAFKPIIYTAALDKGYTPASIIIDAPILGSLEGVPDKWKPKNYGGHFSGPITLHKALTESRNIISIKILRDIGVSYASSYARRFGIESDLNLDLSMALGSSAITLQELVRAFGVFPKGGIRPAFIFIRQIKDRDGNIIEDNRNSLEIKAEAEELLTKSDGEPFSMVYGNEKYEIRNEDDLAEFAKVLKEWQKERGQRYVISPQTAYIMTTIMRDVVRHGTGWRVRALQRPAAGKTGTTNDQIDTWFVGFTPDIVTGVWVGSDQLVPLGKLETGGRTAIPIWLGYMKEAVKGTPVHKFRRPYGIEFAQIDYDNGLLSTPATLHSARLAFKAGTAPRQYSTGETAPEDEGFFRLDMGM
jgi:penicillin-binding protein 1A